MSEVKSDSFLRVFTSTVGLFYIVNVALSRDVLFGEWYEFLPAVIICALYLYFLYKSRHSHDAKFFAVLGAVVAFSLFVPPVRMIFILTSPVSMFLGGIFVFLDLKKSLPAAPRRKKIILWLIVLLLAGAFFFAGTKTYYFMYGKGIFPCDQWVEFLPMPEVPEGAVIAFHVPLAINDLSYGGCGFGKANVKGYLVDNGEENKYHQELNIGEVSENERFTLVGHFNHKKSPLGGVDSGHNSEDYILADSRGMRYVFSAYQFSEYNRKWKAEWVKNNEAIGDVTIEDCSFYDDEVEPCLKRTFSPKYMTPTPLSERGDSAMQIITPHPNEVVASPLRITGNVYHEWFLKSYFPVKLLDGNGKVIAETLAQAQGNQTTSERVSFVANLTFTHPDTKNGMLVLEKNNPSGLFESSDDRRIPIRFIQP